MKNILFSLAKNKEISIVLMVVFVLFMMIIPLNPEIMDFIIGFNISITVLVLMVVLFMNSATELSSFPSILLVLALFRIGITVSTSRLILMDGDAGNIVTTFGEFVAGGNLVIGIIIFITITIVNFIVVIKGSERVAEVAARFSLDAMPGKQMSIDGDLKAGNITMEQANQKRKNLGIESRLYGAMDGAMKFVKGDSIASIIDILINMVGGLIIGIMQKNLSIAEAGKIYTILTIGDGLVQQIPSLLISLTSGLMITKVSDDDVQENLGQNILKQVFSNPMAIFSSCGLILGLAMVPGMPVGAFGILFVIFAVIGILLYKKFTSKKKDGWLVDDSELPPPNLAEKDVILEVVPISIIFSPKIKELNSFDLIKNAAYALRQSIGNDLGFYIPQVVIKYKKELEQMQYELELFEITEVQGNLYIDHILITTPESQIKDLELGEKFANNLEIGNLNKGFWIKKEYLEVCKNNNIKFITFDEVFFLNIKFYLMQQVSRFMGLQETSQIIKKMTTYQELTRELLKMAPLNKITEVFQRLISEGISLRNFKVILDTMLEWYQREKDSIIITEQVRKSLGKQIAFKFSNGGYLFNNVILSKDLEDMVRDSIRYTDTGSYLALDPRITENILNNLEQIIIDNKSLENIVIITDYDIRRYLRSIIEKKFPDIVVLSYQELEGHANYNNVGIIEY